MADDPSLGGHHRKRRRIVDTESVRVQQDAGFVFASSRREEVSLSTQEEVEMKQSEEQETSHRSFEVIQSDAVVLNEGSEMNGREENRVSSSREGKTMFASSASNEKQSNEKSTSGTISNSKSKPQKEKLSYIYGNYPFYYGYRVGSSILEDSRLNYLKKEWFESKNCLDIGCNEGHVTIAIAQKFLVHSILGVDIDPLLIGKARKFLKRYVSSLKSTASKSNSVSVSSSSTMGSSNLLSFTPHSLRLKKAIGLDTSIGVKGGRNWVRIKEKKEIVTEKELKMEMNGEEKHVERADKMKVVRMEESKLEDGNKEVKQIDMRAEYERKVVESEHDSDKHGEVKADANDIVFHEDRMATESIEEDMMEDARKQEKEERNTAEGIVEGGKKNENEKPRMQVETNKNKMDEKTEDVCKEDLMEKVFFRTENFLESKTDFQAYDTVVCLSVTKWIHLNWGDSGLMKFFAKIFNSLKRGGILVLEPQPWISYKKKHFISDVAKKNYQESKIRPEDFPEILLEKIGFKTFEIITPAVKEKKNGFDNRPMFVYSK